MLTPDEQLLLKDVGATPGGYGTPLIAWKNQLQVFKGPPYTGLLGALPMHLAQTFMGGFYVLLKTKRPISIYRGYETEGLEAPFGKDHPSFIRNLVSSRNPGKPDGFWWTPARPSMAIDSLKLSSMHRSQHQANSAIKSEWNRLDYYLESELPIGSTIYVGRAAAQQESAAYGAARLGGGGFQFRLTEPSEKILPWLRRYASA